MPTLIVKKVKCSQCTIIFPNITYRWFADSIFHFQVYNFLAIVFSSTKMVCSCGTGGMCQNKLIYWNSNLPWMTGCMGLFHLQSVTQSLKYTTFSPVWYFSFYCCALKDITSVYAFFNDLNKLLASFELRTQFFN